MNKGEIGPLKFGLQTSNTYGWTLNHASMKTQSSPAQGKRTEVRFELLFNSCYIIWIGTQQSEFPAKTNKTKINGLEDHNRTQYLDMN